MFAVREARAGDTHQRQRFGGFLVPHVEALLHGGHFVGMRGGGVLVLIGIYGEVVEVHAGVEPVTRRARNDNRLLALAERMRLVIRAARVRVPMRLHVELRDLRAARASGSRRGLLH